MKKENILDFVYKAIDEALSNVHTICLVRVEKINQTTIDVKPVIARQVGDKAIPLPVFQNVPPVFMRGGETYTAHPIAVGDFALLLITERCFDNWYVGVNDQAPAVHRMHDYSDGVALVGVSPLASGIPIPTAHVRRVGDSNVTGDYEHDGDYEITGNVTINGTLTITGDGDAGDVIVTGRNIRVISADILADTISLKTHTHDGVQVGGGNTGTPNP